MGTYVGIHVTYTCLSTTNYIHMQLREIFSSYFMLLITHIYFTCELSYFR